MLVSFDLFTYFISHLYRMLRAHQCPYVIPMPAMTIDEKGHSPGQEVHFSRYGNAMQKFGMTSLHSCHYVVDDEALIDEI